MKEVTIIGAGVSGLVCAIELEKSGLTPRIIDRASNIGGRLATTAINGFYLDHGFQVLLTAYPAVKEYLDLDELDLKYFDPGAEIFMNRKKECIGDALRKPSFLVSTVLSSAASLFDKLKILQLSFEMKNQSVEKIFNEPEITTIDFLRNYGFSSRVIDNFFKPFYSGIFLESELVTSARMFKFVFKMFAEGSAAIPKRGMVSIADQLKNKLTRTEFLLETPVKSVADNKIILESGEELLSERIVLASIPNVLSGNNPNNFENVENWRGCTTYYFEYNESNISENIISLVTDQESILANLYCLKSDAGSRVLSVTVIHNARSAKYEQLETQVRKELIHYCQAEVGVCLAAFEIPYSLPILTDLSYQPSLDSLKMSDSLYVCGDHTANASLNAAMLSGKIVAKDIIKNNQVSSS